MRLGLIGLLGLMVAGCASAPVGEPEFAGRFGNACVPEAIAMVEGLRGKGIEARVVIFRASTQASGHAVATYMWPKGQNQLWAWDSTWGSIRLRAWWGEPENIARAWMRATTGKLWIIERAEEL